MHKKPHTIETRKKISLANTGKLSSQWKGDKAKYQALHQWIRTHHGLADHCENPKCDEKSNQYQWALRLGRKYSRNVNDYTQLCRSCHRKMDMTEETKRKISEAMTQHVLCKTGDGKPHLAKGYCQHHYNTIYRKK